MEALFRDSELTGSEVALNDFGAASERVVEVSMGLTSTRHTGVLEIASRVFFAGAFFFSPVSNPAPASFMNLGRDRVRAAGERSSSQAAVN